MSAHKRQLLISRNANRDLANIRVYSQQTWGGIQANEYDADLHAGLALIVDNPFVGKEEPTLGPGTRVMIVRSHRIFYRVDASRIRVLRVLHARQGVQRPL